MIYINVSSPYVDEYNFKEIKDNILKDISILKSLKPNLFIENKVIKYDKYKILQAKNIFEIKVYLELCGIQQDIDYTFDWNVFVKYG